MDNTNLISHIQQRIQEYFNLAVCIDESREDPEYPSECVVRFSGAEVTVFDCADGPVRLVGHNYTALSALEDFKYQLQTCQSVMVIRHKSLDCPEAFDPLPPE